MPEKDAKKSIKAHEKVNIPNFWGPSDNVAISIDKLFNAKIRTFT